MPTPNDDATTTRATWRRRILSSWYLGTCECQCAPVPCPVSCEGVLLENSFELGNFNRHQEERVWVRGGNQKRWPSRSAEGWRRQRGWMERPQRWRGIRSHEQGKSAARAPRMRSKFRVWVPCSHTHTHAHPAPRAPARTPTAPPRWERDEEMEQPDKQGEAFK